MTKYKRPFPDYSKAVIEKLAGIKNHLEIFYTRDALAWISEQTDLDKAIYKEEKELLEQALLDLKNKSVRLGYYEVPREFNDSKCHVNDLIDSDWPDTSIEVRKAFAKSSPFGELCLVEIPETCCGDDNDYKQQ